MLPIVWTARARLDLRTIVEYIGDRNPLAAERMAKIFIDSTEVLPEHPYLYRRSERVPGCREIVAHRNYVVVYRVEMKCIRIVRVQSRTGGWPVKSASL